MTIIPLVICGGSGTRLWPASRYGFPKQFLTLFGDMSSFQATIARVADRSIFAPPIVVTSVDHRFLVRDQLSDMNRDATILLEPMARDSGPAMLAGASEALRQNPDAVVLALAADHFIENPAAFIAACQNALMAEARDRIVCFGVPPRHPSEAYGYIRPGKALADGLAEVAQFIEKPNASDAATYLDGGCYWNSGNLLFRADLFLREYSRFDSRTVETVDDAVRLATRDDKFVFLQRDAFVQATPLSVDYALLEKTDRAAIVPLDCGWSDIGSWRSVWELSAKDGAGNSVRGRAVLHNVRNANVVSEDILVALEGVEDISVVVTPDAVLVSQQRDAGAMKHLVARIGEAEPSLTVEHNRARRPWGYYQSVDKGDRYQVKRIVVTPGGRLSLQKHFHRSEHWIVVRGTARVTIDEQVRTVHENESIFIPLGSVHRLENPGRIPLELIEVQTGSYLGEDDIIRLDDEYRRG